MGGYSTEELALKYLTAPAELNNFFKKIADAIGMNFFNPQLPIENQSKTTWIANDMKNNEIEHFEWSHYSFNSAQKYASSRLLYAAYHLSKITSNCESKWDIAHESRKLWKWIVSFILQKCS